jgi:hypothetical protein
VTEHLLGPDVLAGYTPQAIVRPGHWQSASTTGDWSLVGCTVSPGFRFEGFELAPPGFDIPQGPGLANGPGIASSAHRRGEVT